MVVTIRIVKFLFVPSGQFGFASVNGTIIKRRARIGMSRRPISFAVRYGNSGVLNFSFVRCSQFLVIAVTVRTRRKAASRN